ncbi:MAG: hypothetical protein OXE85_00995 [Roseovarius sp.]|nr:hypothetical protein [Roseovarius sp.]
MEQEWSPLEKRFTVWQNQGALVSCGIMSFALGDCKIMVSLEIGGMPDFLSDVNWV